MSDDRVLKVRSSGVIGTDAFLEASREELRVLVAVMERPFTFSGVDELAEAAGVSRARAASAIALFTEAGIFVREGDVSFEFKERCPDEDSDIERTSAEVAEHIRCRGLSFLFEELATMMERDSLNTDEIKRTNALIADEGLSEEYILTLAAHIASKGALAINKLTRKAKELLKKGIDTQELLEDYIKRDELGSALELEFRHTFGKYLGNATKTELDYYRKWTETFGFTPEVILLAQDINVRAKTTYSYAYIDTLLTRWHECGCKTPAECEAQAQLDRESIAKQKRLESATAPRRTKAEEKTPKFADFDPEEALERALERSYAKYSESTDK